jgi:hypothetical protein
LFVLLFFKFSNIKYPTEKEEQQEKTSRLMQYIVQGKNSLHPPTTHPYSSSMTSLAANCFVPHFFQFQLLDSRIHAIKCEYKYERECSDTIDFICTTSESQT